MSYFVAGTDTHAGKTLISCALLHGFAKQGKRVVGMKPVAAGCTEDGQNEDVLLLRAAGNLEAGYGQLNPYCFHEAIAPHIAAKRAGVEIDCSVIAKSYQALAAQADVVIVEGTGGLLVPLNAHQDGADLVDVLGLPVILVVGMRLGCLNHALLTVEVIAARGLTLAGWVANVVQPGMMQVGENVSTLQQRVKAPLLGIVPYLQPADAGIAAKRLDLSLLVG